MFDLPKILKFSKNDIKQFADRTLGMHKVQINAGIDANGQKFKPYSIGYAKSKKNNRRTPVTLKDTGKMLKSFKVLKADYKTKEIKFKYGTQANKQGKKMNEHNDGSGRLPSRQIADDNALGPMVEKSIVRTFAQIINKNLLRMTKTKHLVKLG